MRGQATPCTSSQTKAGLALVRDLAMSRQLVHDVTTTELDETVAVALVKEAASGLFLVAKALPRMPAIARYAVQTLFAAASLYVL